jgi:ubiquinone/menaquinone biosynthesis C-methylase UbiE
MVEIKFDPAKLQKLNNPDRLQDLPPEKLMSKLADGGRNTVIELGAGTAFFSVELLRLTGASTFFCCDISDSMLRWMEENIVPAYPQIHPVKTEEVKLPFESDFADLIYTINVHHEFKSPVESLLEMYQVLKPGGEIFVADWLKKEMQQGPPQSIRYTAEAVALQLKETGFQRIEIHNIFEKHLFVTASK